MIKYMDSTGSIWSMGYRELIKKEMVILGKPTFEKYMHFYRWFLRCAFIFCKKRPFFNFYQLFLEYGNANGSENLDFQKLHSICNSAVYNMSIFDENWRGQNFFTKICPLSRRKVLVAWTLSYLYLGCNWTWSVSLLLR